MPRLHPLLRDSLLPLAIGGLVAVEVVAARPEGTPAVLALLGAASAALVLRRVWPLAAGTLGGAALLLPFVGPAMDELGSPMLVFWLATFTLGRWLPDLRGLPVAVLFVVVVLGVDVGWPPPLGDVLWVGVLALGPYAAGVAVRTLDARHRGAAEQAAQLAAAQERVRAEAAAAERARIARELHDVLAHSVSAMVVQTAAAEDLVRTDPERAARLLADVTSVGRSALAETGRLLHLIRDPGGELGLTPDAGVARLPELVEGVTRRGLAVDLRVDGAADRLPPGVDLSAYRIVQEGLTNALRHGGGSAVVQVSAGPAGLVVRVENPLGPGGTGGSGLGLVGVAERVAVFGGSLSHGATDDGRYVLRARLPLAGTAADALAPAETAR